MVSLLIPKRCHGSARLSIAGALLRVGNSCLYTRRCLPTADDLSDEPSRSCRPWTPAVVALIKNSGDPLALQESRLTSLLLFGKMGQPFLNPARITEIVAAFPAANYTSITDNDVDSYNMDFGVHMIPGNYALFVTQQDPHATSVGVYRQGPMNDIFGRFGRRFASADGKDRMTFAVDPALLGDAAYSVRVLVTALDDGAGKWSLRYWDGSAEQTADTVTNTDTGASITHVFEIPALVAGGHLPASGDLALQHEAGADTTFFVVEVERRAQLSD